MTSTPLDKPRPLKKPALSHTAVYWIGFSVVLALLIVAPLVLPVFWAKFLTEILIWGLLAMSSDILIGYAGMVSFGHSAFFGLGMYGAAAALLLFSPAISGWRSYSALPAPRARRCSSPISRRGCATSISPSPR